MNKSTKEEWVKWAEDNKIDKAVIEYVQQNPHLMQTIEEYTEAHDEAAKNNPYIFKLRSKHADNSK
jgi:hypothetical protein